ncbi:MAG: adenylyltransferase, partial [Anaerolineales bacterium]
MKSDRSILIPPYGDALVDLLVSDEALWAQANTLPSIQLSERAVCDLELLAVGGFSPLDRFMGQADYERVLGEMRLASGHIFPIPVTLPVSADNGLHLDQDVALRNDKNELLAVMTVEEFYSWDRAEMAERVFGTTDPRHPLVAEMQRWG